MVEDWFRVREVEQGILAVDEPGHVQSYLVRGAARAALVDTGMGFCDISAALALPANEHDVVLNTHHHFDHLGGNALFEQRGVSALEAHLVGGDWPSAALLEMVVEPARAEGLSFPSGFEPAQYSIRGAAPTFTIAPGEHIDLGGRTLEAIATPGHTHGSLSFRDSLTGALLVGDLAYNGAIYAHLDDSSVAEYSATLDMLLERAGDFSALYPAHNDYPLPVAFLAELRAAFRQIAARSVQATRKEGWGRPVLRYPFDGFSILLADRGQDTQDW